MPARDETRANVHLTLALGDYDHTRDLVTGEVRVPGIDLTCMSFSIEETFSRFARFREWDISEFSLSQYCSMGALGDDWLTALPVFPSRRFTHGSIFVRRDGPVDDPRALAGGRIGTPDWADPAGIYTRGLLQHQYGLDLSGIKWFQNVDATRLGRLGWPDLPDGFEIEPVTDLSLYTMLAIGELDAVIATHLCDDFAHGDGTVTRLFSEPRAEEEAYYRDTGVFPIMHLMALRRDVYDAHPWIAMNLYNAFQDAKRRSVRRALDGSVSRYPVPWGTFEAQRAEHVFGPDLWPYGIDENRCTLDAFLEFAYEQGVCAARLAPDDLFPTEVGSAVRI